MEEIQEALKKAKAQRHNRIMVEMLKVLEILKGNCHKLMRAGKAPEKLRVGIICSLSKK